MLLQTLGNSNNNDHINSKPAFYNPVPSSNLLRPTTLLYYTILYYTILYYTILYYTILYYTILYYTILYYTILYYTILYYTILYYTILYYTLKGLRDFFEVSEELWGRLSGLDLCEAGDLLQGSSPKTLQSGCLSRNLNCHHQLNWVALKLSYHDPETRLFTIYPHDGNSDEVPQQQANSSHHQ